MPDRQVERTAGFEKDLKALSRKHPGLGQCVDEALAEYATNGKSATSFQIPNLNGLPGIQGSPRLWQSGETGRRLNHLFLRRGPRVGIVFVHEGSAIGRSPQ